MILWPTRAFLCDYMNINSIYWILQHLVWLITNFLHSIVKDKNIWSSPFSWHVVWQAHFFAVIGSNIQENVQLNSCHTCGTRKRAILSSFFFFFTVIPEVFFSGWNYDLLNYLAKLALSSAKQRFCPSWRLSYLLNWVWALVTWKPVFAIIIKVAFLSAEYFGTMFLSSLDLPS